MPQSNRFNLQISDTMKTNSLITFFILLVFTGHSFAQKVQPIDKTNQVNVERLGRIDRVFEEYVSNQWINGGEVIVYHQDQLIYHKAHGYRDVDQKEPLEKNSIYRMASQTKLITTVGIMMLLEQGKFLLNDPISKFLPEFKNPLVLDSYSELDTTFTTIPASREITFKDLLTHTSGIGYPQIGSPQMTAIYYKSGVYGGLGLVNETTLSQQMELLAKNPLFNQPGEKYTYGLNIDLLGYLIEVISGQSLWDFYQKEIFEPLGMKDTWFFLPKDKHARLVPLYLETENRTVTKASEYFDIGGRTLSNYPITKGTYYSGGAGLSSTAEDYTTFLRMILNGGELNGHKFLSSASIRLMTTNQIGNIEFSKGGDGNKFGFGLVLVTEESSTNSLVTPGSYEAGGAFSTYFWVDPEREIIGQMMLNKFPNSHFDIFRKLQNLVYQALD
jgi:CubicO group peptidase (beta-lactamase class C family)